MENIIQSYLTKHYEINTSEIGNDGIYEKKDTRRHRPPYHQNKLLKELVMVFSVDEVTGKRIIQRWASLIKNDIDLTFYWLQLEYLTFSGASTITNAYSMYFEAPVAGENIQVKYILGSVD